MIDSSKSDGTQCVFLIDFLRGALANMGAQEDDLVKRLRSLKCLRDLIVHPRSFIFEVDDSGNFQEIPTKQHKYISETLPHAINNRGNIVIDGALIQQSIEDTRKVIERIVQRCEYVYLYAWQQP